MFKNSQVPSSSIFSDAFTHPTPPAKSTQTPSETAIVYCEGNFGEIDGKTANGLVRHSDKYEIRSIIDGEKAGQDAGQSLESSTESIGHIASLPGTARSARWPNR